MENTIEARSSPPTAYHGLVTAADQRVMPDRRNVDWLGLWLVDNVAIVTAGCEGLIPEPRIRRQRHGYWHPRHCRAPELLCSGVDEHAWVGHYENHVAVEFAIRVTRRAQGRACEQDAGLRGAIPFDRWLDAGDRELWRCHGMWPLQGAASYLLFAGPHSEAADVVADELGVGVRDRPTHYERHGPSLCTRWLHR